MPPLTEVVNRAAWQAYAAEATAGEEARDQPPTRLEWTQVPGLGPGAELLGPIDGRRVLELGCGPGDTSAYLAGRGAYVVAVDAAPAQVERARIRWPHAGVDFIAADAATYLHQAGLTFDMVISVFGALDWTPPDRLLPLIAARLHPAGVLALSTIHPAWANRVGSELRCHSGRSVPVVRHATLPQEWPPLLEKAGLAAGLVQVVEHPIYRVPCCTVITATRLTASGHRAVTTGVDRCGGAPPR
jgi:2-polyprenyl-3-methyl-5-hydroxy-6-metoxy-1,4-benzoquinol methylase